MSLWSTNKIKIKISICESSEKSSKNHKPLNNFANYFFFSVNDNIVIFASKYVNVYLHRFATVVMYMHMNTCISNGKQLERKTPIR